MLTCRGRAPLAAPLAHIVPATPCTCLHLLTRLSPAQERILKALGVDVSRGDHDSDDKDDSDNAKGKGSPGARSVLRMCCPVLLSCPAVVLLVELSGRKLARDVNVTAPEETEKADEAAAAAWLVCVPKASAAMRDVCANLNGWGTRLEADACRCLAWRRPCAHSENYTSIEGRSSEMVAAAASGGASDGSGFMGTGPGAGTGSEDRMQKLILVLYLCASAEACKGSGRDSCCLRLSVAGAFKHAR